MHSQTLHIFNPETDYALAVGDGPYTPPGHVKELREKFALLPALYALPGDFILTDSAFSPSNHDNEDFLPHIKSKGLRIVSPDDLPELWTMISRINPWGWNHNLKRFLISAGSPEDILPSDNNLDKLRQLAHRASCIPFRKFLYEKLGNPDCHCGKQLLSIEEVVDFLEIHPYSYFKAPWSSSGRGVVSSTHISRKGLLEWASGCLRRQGSVIAEIGWNRKLDFASEWWCEKGDSLFLGLSVFTTSPRGKYQGNVEASQEALAEKIKKATPLWNESIIDMQKEALQKMVAPVYDGPVGIDMLCDEDGMINPCVEINLRITMGHVALWKNTGHPFSIAL